MIIFVWSTGTVCGLEVFSFPP